jgi:hypothetical protein
MELLEKIIALEWAMFQLVQNEGGRASCQDNYPTFRIMRESQFSAWPDAVLRSYLSDLEQAEAEGRNLVMEKYARMMERTAPERYREISAYLPPLGTGETEAIRQIMDIQQNWTRAAAAHYPHIVGQGRAVSSTDDRAYAASSETYLRSELATYSPETLRLLLSFLSDADRKGENLTERILERTVKGYGFSSLDEAEARLASR